MKPRFLVVLLLLLAAAGYAVGRVQATLFGFLVFYVVDAVALAGLVAMCFAFPVADLVARMVARDVRDAHMARIRVAVLGAFVFFCAAGLFVNAHWLPDRMHPMSLASDAIVFGLSLVLGWSLVRPSARRAAVAGASALSSALVIAVLALMVPRGQAGTAPSPVEKLKSLAYLTWVPDERTEDLAGVVHYDREKAFPGLNFYSSRNLPSAFLMDMDGNIVHEWTAKTKETDKWAHVELCPNGDVLAMVSLEKLLRVSWDSRIVWSVDLSAHHDVELMPDGEILTLANHDGFATVRGVPVPIIQDYVSTFTPPDGAVRSVSLLDIVGNRVPLSHVLEIYEWLARYRGLQETIAYIRDPALRFSGKWPVDLFHTNTADIIDRDVDDVFRKGNILLCVRNLDLVCVYDPEAREVVWSWGPGDLQKPHNPNLLDNGNLLIFDNGMERDYSRVIELDPRTKTIVWEYTADPKDAFFSASRGSCQRLPNGNTLVTSSDRGRVFEVTADGEVVWDFYNPVIHEKRHARAAIYRMLRLPRDYPGLERLSEAPAPSGG